MKNQSFYTRPGRLIALCSLMFEYSMADVLLCSLIFWAGEYKESKGSSPKSPPFFLLIFILFYYSYSYSSYYYYHYYFIIIIILLILLFIIFDSR